MSWLNRKRRRSMLLAIAAAAIAAGVIVASVSAAGSPHHHKAGHARLTHAERGSARARGLGERAAAARYLGLTRSQLRSKLRGGQTLAQIANATPGKSAKGLIEALVKASQRASAASLHARVALAVTGARGSSTRAAAAQYLGTTVAKLRRQLRSGKSLAQVANGVSGKSATGLIGALITVREAQVKAAVSSGALSQQQADAYLSNLRARITHAVERTHRAAAR